MSSSPFVIEAEGLGKDYLLFDRPYQRIAYRLGFSERFEPTRFRALDTIDFQIRAGETVGVIGRNGSGKSTLLQLVSGILTPTRGRVQTKGRISALLELGAGFSPEFTGRENIRLNAQILGFDPERLPEVIPKIHAFSEIEDALDRPVKTYSSGMFVRLAFATAIHLEPEILVVDEALAVGDLGFQNKCMRRIEELKSQGVTILFVSQDLGQVQTVCERALWIHEGQIREDGPAVQVCQNAYAALDHGKGASSARAGEERQVIIQQSTENASFVGLRLRAPDPEPQGSPERKPRENHEPVLLAARAPLVFEFEVDAPQPLGEVVVAISLFTRAGDWMVGQTSREEGVTWDHQGGPIAGTVRFDPNVLGPGDYVTAFAVYSKDLSVCHAMTGKGTPFSIRSEFPIWGRIFAPCSWTPKGAE